MTGRPTAPVDSEALLARVRAVLSAEGTEVSEEALCAAVAAHVQPTLPVMITPAAGSETTFDFGWERPTDKTTVEARWRCQPWLRWPHQLATWVRRPRQGARLTGVVLGLLICLGVTTGKAGLMAVLQGGLLTGTLGLVAWPLWAQLRRQQRRYEVVVPTQEGWAAWAAHPRARAYVEACLASRVPFLLAGDLRRLRVIMGEG